MVRGLIDDHLDRGPVVRLPQFHPLVMLGAALRRRKITPTIVPSVIASARCTATLTGNLLSVQ